MQLFHNLGRKIGHGLEELTLTTNGSQLARYAKDLFDNGVRRINVSLDSLEQKKFKKIKNYWRRTFGSKKYNAVIQ